MDDPYKYRPVDEGEVSSRSHRVGRCLAVTGAFSQLAGPVAVVAWAIAVSGGLFQPATERSEVAGWVAMIAFAGWVLGLILLMIALLGTRYRARWFFWFLTIYGAALTLAMPLVPFGIVFLVYALVRRRDFFVPAWHMPFHARFRR